MYDDIKVSWVFDSRFMKTTPVTAETKPVDPERMAQRFAARFALPLDDIRQDIQVSIIEHKALYESLLVAPACDYQRWLYNKVWQQLRHRYVRRARKTASERTLVLVGWDDVVTSDVLAVDGSMPALDLILDVRSAVAALPQNYRDLLQAVSLDGLSFAEYAAQKGVSQPAVSQMYARAKAAMKALLTGYDTETEGDE